MSNLCGHTLEYFAASRSNKLDLLIAACIDLKTWCLVKNAENGTIQYEKLLSFT